MNEAPVKLSSQNIAQKGHQDRMEALVGYILLVGVLLSVGLIVLGTAWNWVLHHSLTLQYSIARQNYFSFLYTSLVELFRGAIRPELLVSLGIATLLFTPYLRVAASAVYFATVEKNVKYTVFTLFVFAVLTYSLFLR